MSEDHVPKTRLGRWLTKVAARQTPPEEKIAVEEETARALTENLIRMLDRLDALEAHGRPTAEELAEDWRRWMEGDKGSS